MTLENALRHAIETGLGFHSAAETRAVAEWALAEIDRLREQRDRAIKALRDLEYGPYDDPGCQIALTKIGEQQHG